MPRSSQPTRVPAFRSVLPRKAADRVSVRLAAVPGTAAGGAAIGTNQVNRQVQQDLTHAEELAFPVLFVLALIVFGSGVAALLPLVSGALTIVGALLLLRLLDAVTPISTYALNIVTGAGLGLAIDYSLLLVSRYREELAQRGPGADAVRATVATAGRTVAFSSVTVGVSIATLAVFPLGFLRSMGIAGALVGPLAGLVSLTVLPPLFFLLGPRINALPVRRQAATPRERGAWYRLAHALMRRPVPFAALAATVLILAGIPFTSIRFTGIDASVLPEGVSSRAVDDALRSEFRSAGVSPAYAVVHGSAHSLLRAVGPVWTLERSRKETHADLLQVRPRGGPRRARHRRSACGSGGETTPRRPARARRRPSPAPDPGWPSRASETSGPCHRVEDTYGVVFGSFKPSDAWPVDRRGVDSGAIDVGLLFSTSSVINANGWVVLEDEKHLQQPETSRRSCARTSSTTRPPAG